MPLAEWFVVEGIGEHRALLEENGRIVAAKFDWPGELVPGQVDEAVLIERRAGSPRGTVRLPSGATALIDRLPPNASEGAAIRVRVRRAAMQEAGRHKPAQVRPTGDPLRPPPTLAERLGGRVVRSFGRDEWADIFHAASTGHWPFPKGELNFFPTPAMTLVDIDGDLPPRALALAAVGPLARAIRLLDLSGSIGIDFPTLPSRDDRKAVDGALAEALADWPHERTAMNGFGFVQIVARAEAPSLLHRVAFDRAGAEARYMINHAAELGGPGVTELAAHPAVVAALRGDWMEELKRRTARDVTVRSDPALAEMGWHAQIVPR